MQARSVTRPLTRPVGRDLQGRNLVAAAIEAAIVADFPFSGSLDARVGTGPATLTRASNATQLSKITGNVEAKSSNEACFEAPGISMFQARTNQIVSSTPVFNASWSGVGVTAEYNSGVEAMPGYTTSAKVIVGSDTDCSIYPIWTEANSAAGTASVWVKGDSGSAGKTIDIVLIDLTVGAAIGVDTLTLSETPQRIKLQGTATTATNTMLMAVGKGPTYGGTSNLAEGDVFYVDGFQYETGTGATPNIFTSGSAATRVKDVLTIPVANMPAYSGDMSIGMTFSLADDPSDYHGLFAATGENAREGVIDNATQKLLHFIPGADASAGRTIEHYRSVRYLLTYDANGNWIAYLDGVQDDTAAVGVISGALTSLYIFGSDSGTYPLHGWGRNLKIYNRILTAAEAKVEALLNA